MHRSKWMILAIVIVCQLVVVLDSSVMVTAIPEIGRSLRMSTTDLTWVQNSYVLAFGGLLLLGARAGDLLGRRRVLAAGIGLFSLTSLLAGAAPNAQLLLAARALQGLSAALATPAALALLSATYVEAKERTKAIALYSAVSAGGGSIGLLLGGWFTDFVSWRLGMFINVPIGLILLVLIRKYVPHSERREGRFDPWGALASVIGMTALVFGFVQAADYGWGKPEAWIPLAIGALSTAAFVLIEARVAEPMIPLRLFANRQRSAAYLGRFLLVGGNFSLFFFIPQYLQNALGFDSFEAGLAFLPFTIAQFGMMYAIPGLLRRYGNARVLGAGLVLAIAGTLWLSRIVAVQAPFFPDMFFLLAIMGIGAGMAFQPLTAMGLAGVGAQDSGAASGLVNVAHQCGASVGLAVLVTVFRASGNAAQPTDAQFAHAISGAMLGSVLFVAAALAVTLISMVPARQAGRKLRMNES